MRQRSTAFLASVCAVSCLGLAAVHAAPARQPAAAIVSNRFPTKADLAVEKALKNAGYALRRLDFDAALAPESLKPYQLLALQDATSLPVAFHKPLQTFLHRGGNLIAFGLPACKFPLLKVDGRFVSADEYVKSTAWEPTQNPLIDLSSTDLAGWTRSSNTPSVPTMSSIDRIGSDSALHVVIPDLTSWDTFGPPPIDQPFRPGDTVTVFCAKGGPRTNSLAVEWEEKDGSRWIATVPLTREWRRYELPPSAFRYWNSNPERGRAGDLLNPQNASRLSVGLAFSHTSTGGGRQEYWIGNLGTTTVDDAPISALNSEEEIDGLYPGYKSFTVHGATSLGGFGTTFRLPPGVALRSPHPRPSGAGFEKGRKVRFVPLLTARSAFQAWRGTPGAMYVHNGGRYGRGVWALFGFTDPRIVTDPRFVRGLTSVAKSMRGPMLVEGGSEKYTYFPGQKMRIGAYAAGPGLDGASIGMTITDSRTGRVLLRSRWPANVRVRRLPWTPPPGANGPLKVLTVLERGRSQIDSISQDIHLWAPPAKRIFVTTKAGQFRLNGKPWKINGVNYMPSSGVARDAQDGNDFEFWLDPAPYDPEIISRDLDNVKRLGLNAISIFVYARSLKSGNLLDMLRQCSERGLKADVSLRPGTPMDFQWDQIKPLITEYRLRDNDTVIAYDLAWEPFFGGRSERVKYDALWTKWAVRKYGSIDAATRAWDYTPRIAGNVLEGAGNAELASDGLWTKFVVDYRQFVDDLVGERYARARGLVRSVDPNHLVSFRMTETSNPTFNWDANLPYDFRGLKNAVDFFAPEGYGRMGAWDHTKDGWFEVAYGRAINPDLPVIWKEAGKSAWQPGLDEAPPEQLKAQGDQIATFYRMVIASGSNGVYWWWYPGGFRYGEDSDYGIINPDGTARPSTKAILANGRAFLKAPAPRKTDATLTIRLDQHATGLYGAYMDVKDRYWALIGAGRSPKVIVER